MVTTQAENIWLLINKTRYTEKGVEAVEGVARFFLQLREDIGVGRFNQLYSHITNYDWESLRIMQALTKEEE